RNSPTIDIMHTLLGIELKVGKVRMLCPDLATARYLSVFARIGCEEVAIPYDITQISWIADELESSWHRMMLLVEHFTRGRTARLRSLVRRKLLTQVKESVLAAGAGSKFPHFSRPAANDKAFFERAARARKAPQTVFLALYARGENY